MSKKYGTITVENVVDLSNFTAQSGENLYIKIDGSYETRGHLYEFKSVDGGVKFKYTVNRNALWQPFFSLRYSGNLKGISNGETTITSQSTIEYYEDSGSIEMYVDGQFVRSANALPNLASVYAGYYFSIDPTVCTNSSVVFDMNIPMVIVSDEEHPDYEDRWKSFVPPQYPDAETVKDIVINYATGFIADDTKQYYIYNTYASGKGTFDGFVKSGSDVIKNQRIFAEAGHHLALYLTPSDNSLKLVYSQPSIYQVYYGDGNGFYDNGDSIAYDTFYAYWRGRLGVTTAASHLSTNIPIFETYADANGYLNGDVSIDRAINFDELSGDINPTNKTGLMESSTEFSDTYHTGVFGIQLACSISALREISSNIFTNDASIIDNIKKGLEMYGSNPIDSIIDLSYYPFDITSLVSDTVSQNYVNFGAYRANLTHNVHRLVYNNGYINCGSVSFLPTYQNYMDYTHTGLEVYLPYIGFKSLDTNNYMGHTISVRYYIDFHTRGCTACILSDGLLCDYFEGQIGISQPINATNFSEYATQTINTLVGGVASLGGSGGSVISGISKAVVAGQSSQTDSAPNILAGVAEASVGGGNAFSNIASTVYDVSINNAKNMTSSKGNLGADTGGHMPQYVFFRFTYEDPIEPNNLLGLYGKPSNTSGRILNYGGFLKCSVVDLECAGATDSEKNEIISLLKSGIRI